MKSNELIKQTHPLITSDHLRRLAIVYVRQSTEEQVRDNTGSTEYQRGLTEVGRSLGWHDSQIQIIDEDLGRSGSSAERRTGLQRLQMMIAANQVGVVIVATVSRLSRNVLDFELFRILAAAHNTLLYTDGRLVDPADSNDTIVSQISAMVAHFENRKRTEIMSRARKVRAKQGAVVSTLPVGWIKGPDGKYDFDPETKDTIRTIIDTFWQTRTLHRTVVALIKAGVQIPGHHGQRVDYKKPHICRVRNILIHPAYAGIYVYGRTEAMPGGPVLARGELQRIKVPEERWVKNFNHHPGYMTVEQQEEIKSILKKNHFGRRDRPGRGPALLQGLLRCAKCNASFHVKYICKRSYSYACAWSVEGCTRFGSYEFDKQVLAELFKVLKTPPLDMLKAALEEARSQERAQLNWIESGRERLRHEEQRARDRADATVGSLPRVYRDALERLDKVLEEKDQFEQKIAMRPAVPKSYESDEELEALCRRASDVPSLWNHPVVTFQEQKEILRCIIDHVVVAVTKERLDATIFWTSGAQTSFSMWRNAGRYNLIRELHAQKLTTFEIREHLAGGRTSTGQTVNFTLNRIRFIQQKLGLKPHRISAGTIPLGKEAAELKREGRSVEWIAHHFNERGLVSPRGKWWTARIIYDLMAKVGEKVETLGNIHRKAILDARARGLGYREMAVEFNENEIPRRKDCHRPWTERNLAHTWSKLNLRYKHKESPEREQSDAVVIRGGK